MGNQKVVTQKKARGRPRGDRGSGRGGNASRGRDSQSATPGAIGSGPKPKLKLKWNKNSAPSECSTPLPQYDEQPEEEDALPVVSEVTTRTGRTSRPPKHLDDIDYDLGISLSSDQVNGDDEDDYQPRMRNRNCKYCPYAQGTGTDVLTCHAAYAPHHVQGAPDVYTLSAAPKKPRGRPKKNMQKQFVYNVDGEDAPSSQTIIIGDQPASLPDNHEVYDILSSLRSTSKIHIDLPKLANAVDPEKVQPYSAQFLTQLYISCYRDKCWDLCDLIADTWIRAFHEQRAQGQQYPTNAIWRPNPALERRKRKALEHNKGLATQYHIPSGFDPSPKNYNLQVEDPELEPDVTVVHIDLVNELYARTGKDCGARMLWADAMALGGDKMEKFLERVAKCRFELHTDLVFNVMQTGLRMCRRNLTLKIEESTEGAWCKRYHEHGRHGLPCYREKAWKKGEEDDNQDKDPFAAFMQQDEGAHGAKRGFRDVDDGEMSPAKRIRFTEDLDAEGDSEED
jgi:hypothetical protein